MAHAGDNPVLKKCKHETSDAHCEDCIYESNEQRKSMKRQHGNGRVQLLQMETLISSQSSSLTQEIQPILMNFTPMNV